MKSVNVAEATLEEVVEQAAAAGEPVEITRDGAVVARLSPAPRSPTGEPYDWDEHLRTLSRMTPQTESAGEFVRRMRDSDRY